MRSLKEKKDFVRAALAGDKEAVSEMLKTINSPAVFVFDYQTNKAHFKQNVMNFEDAENLMASTKNEMVIRVNVSDPSLKESEG